VLALCEGDGEGGLLAGLRRACSTTGQLAVMGNRAETARQLLESAFIQVDEARRELQALQDSLELDPQRLAEVEARLSAIYTLARKHRVPPGELHRLQQELGAEAAGLEVSDTRIEALEAQLHDLARHWSGLAGRLGAARTETAQSISTQVQEQLAFLGMGNCRFSVALKPLADATPSPHGSEQIEFLVATNPGAAADALARIASGGELSRVSLAIQVIIASRATTPTVIFDEVDVGIGGATADAVGSLLQRLGERIQVLCVTHLPQVAARGAHHLRASKQSDGESTSAALAPLAADERVEELARMLGGKTVTKKTREHAREMLEAASA
jgi:DNA repair protein RecN (Recombination protein N)